MITFWAALMVLAAVTFVSWPLVGRRVAKTARVVTENGEFGELLAQKDAALFAINELESDYEMGSLSKTDYQELRSKYEEKALSLIKTADEIRNSRNADVAKEIDEEIEEKVAGLRTQGVKAVIAQGGLRASRVIGTARTCPDCGTQVGPEDDFCFRCGMSLTRKCPNCSAAVGADDRFCAKCGTKLGTAARTRKVG